MNSTVIAQEDIKVLQKSSSKVMRLMTFIVFPVFSVLLIVAGVINLYFCSRFSDMAGTSMAEVIRGWFAGIDTSALYSGTYLMAQERWVTSITQFALAGFVVVIYVGARRAANRNTRILKFIKEKNI